MSQQRGLCCTVLYHGAVQPAAPKRHTQHANNWSQHGRSHHDAHKLHIQTTTATIDHGRLVAWCVIGVLYGTCIRAGCCAAA